MHSNDLNEVIAGTPKAQYHDRFRDKSLPCRITVNGKQHDAYVGQTLQDVLNRGGVEVPQVCYHPQLGPIQTCDTCMVEVDGKLVRACAHAGCRRHEGVDQVRRAPTAAQREAFDRILGNHLLYCTVCDNNNGNCTVHNTTKLLAVEHQEIPFKPKPYEVDNSNPFYRYDPDQCILCGRCVEACQNLQVNETLSHQLGRSRIRACCGTAARRSANRVASPAAIASRSARAMRSWKNPCWARPASSPRCPRPR